MSTHNNNLNSSAGSASNTSGSTPFSRPGHSAHNSPIISPTARRLGLQPLEVRIPTTTTDNDNFDPNNPTQTSSLAQHPTSATSAYPPRGFQHLDRRRKGDNGGASPTTMSPVVGHGFNGALRASANPHPTATANYGQHESDPLEGVDASSSLLRSKFDALDEKDVGVRSTPILGRTVSPRRRSSLARPPSFSRSGRPTGLARAWLTHFVSVLGGRRMRVLVLLLLAGLVTVLFSSGGDLDKVQQTVSHAPGYSKVQDAWAWAETQRKGAAEAAGIVKDKALAWVGRPRPLNEEEQAIADELDASVGGADELDELKEELEELEAELEDQRAKNGKAKAEAAAKQKAKEAEEDFDLPPAAKLPTFDDDSDASDDITGGKGQGSRPGAKTGAGSGAKVATTGRDGSTVTMEDGTTFVYRNKFGGSWDSDPLSTSARAQSYTPPLSKAWDYSNSQIYGVNLGGWLTLEPFITPYLYEPFEHTDYPAEDEWTLSQNLGDDLAEVLEDHYNTFITEQDFADIAAAGLNWVRIPVPYWAIDPRPETEPFLPYVAWKYFIKSMAWARKYGIRINLDLHTAPGSQNGWNHSGRIGVINFLMGTMGLANAQRTLSIIRALAEFISLPGNRDVVPMFSILNEPFWIEIGDEPMRNFYFNAYKMIRDLTGVGVGKGPQLAIHDGFHGTGRWFDYLRGADRLALDSHRYLCFMPPNDEPLIDQALKPCVKWAHEFNKTMDGFGLSLSGEWSIAVNDCGRYLNAVGAGARFDGTFPNASAPLYEGVGSCDGWEDYETWDDEMKEDLHRIALAHMDTFQNWFYWTWKTGKTLTTGRIANPLWSYQLGLEQGWMPKDPRSHKGACGSIATAAGTHMRTKTRTATALPAWQTGGAGAGRLTREDEERYAWPPEELVGGLKGKDLPQYTQTGAPLVLTGGPTPAPTRMGVAVKGAVGAEVPRKTTLAWVPIEGCDEYPEPWSGNGAPLPDRRKCGALDRTGRGKRKD